MLFKFELMNKFRIGQSAAKVQYFIFEQGSTTIQRWSTLKWVEMGSILSTLTNDKIKI